MIIHGFVSLLFISQIFNPPEFPILGLWHSSDVLGSGYSDVYLFYDNGDYYFYYSQMDCDNPNIMHSGKYFFESDTILRLVKEKKSYIHDGILKPVIDGSCASDFYIEGGEILEEYLENPILQNIRIYNHYKDEELYDVHTVKFDEVRFWRISSSPDVYLNY